jgi:hypothetical protein
LLRCHRTALSLPAQVFFSQELDELPGAEATPLLLLVMPLSLFYNLLLISQQGNGRLILSSGHLLPPNLLLPTLQRLPLS